MLTFLLNLRALVKTKPLAVVSLDSEEIIRNAMGYAWELGFAKDPYRIVAELSASSTNPFLDPKWREKVIPNAT